MKLANYIFWGVFLDCFTIQYLSMGFIATPDTQMWANQIGYFLGNDPQVYNFYLAYGHPGTTLVGLGSLLHLVFGLSYVKAVILGMSLLIGAASAASAAICFLLYPQSLWWLTTAGILSFSRLYSNATPPTAIVLPFIVLIVLATWWLWERGADRSNWPAFWWGVVVGLSAATRLDATLLVGLPFGFLLAYRRGPSAIGPALAGAAAAFFLADPFLWSLPLQHMSDLLHKFVIHYHQYKSPVRIGSRELASAIPLALISMLWCLVMPRIRPQQQGMPPLIGAAFLAITLAATGVILSSSFQDIRYFYPCIMVWEILLPFFALQTCVTGAGPGKTAAPRQGPISWAIVCVVFLTQMLGYWLMI